MGGVPCTRCRQGKTACIINEEMDNRRKIGLMRKIQSLEHDRVLLTQLLDALRIDSNHNTSGILNLIRNNASLNEIRLRVTEILDFRNPRKYMDVVRLSDIPLYRVSARPWTTATDDDDFVSHLISLYFTWHHQALNWVDRDLFMRDMRSGHVDSQFCSPPLVNSALAVACVCVNRLIFWA